MVPEENDLALAKLSAWRDKDRAWLIEGLKAGVLSLTQMAARIERMPQPNAEGNPPAPEILRDRMTSLASLVNIELSKP
ncbi:MAG: hypothetical protein WDO17_21570 [Alphaproteobacteria bacterium]